MEFFWDFFDSWEQAENAWDNRAREAAACFSLDIPSHSPSTVQVAAEKIPFLRLRGLSWVLHHDKRKELRHYFSRNPVNHLVQYTKSFLKKKPYICDEDFFYYGVQSREHMLELLRQESTLLLVGFSYCQKPKECPSVRFSDKCRADDTNPVCQQCFIGKVRHALPNERTLFVIVPTINSIGEEVVRAMMKFSDKKICFLIASCEMALTMFGDLGNMVGAQGIGVRLSGRVCNTFDAFALSEQGIKPGMTWLVPETEKKFLSLVRGWRELG